MSDNKDSTSQYPLRTVQQWMKSAIVTQGTITDVLHNDSVEQLLPFESAMDLVLPSRTLSQEQRIEIYRTMYPLRMVEALEADYPTLARFMGEDFETLVMRYVEEYPSQSYTLNHLGKHLPAFLQNSTDYKNSELLHDIALMELAISDVIDEEEVEIFDSNDLTFLDEQTIENLVLEAVPAFRLQALSTNAVEYLSALDNDEDFPTENKQQSYAIVYRKDYSTDYVQLDDLEYTILKKIVDGEPLFQTLNTIPFDENSSLEELQNRVSQYFSNWVQYGIFRSIKHPAPC